MEDHSKKIPGHSLVLALAILLLGILLGAAVYVFLDFRMRPEPEASRTIHLSRDDQARLAVNFAEIVGRPPTKPELETAIAAWVRDEVLYREALRRRLGTDDPIVRKRLAQKMAELAVSQSGFDRPDEATLREWLAKHPERFADDVAETFDQLYFTTRSHALVAKTLLEGGADWRKIGDPVSLPQHFERAGREAIAAELGDEFARTLDTLTVGRTWQGPVEGALGWHLVRLTAREPGHVPPFAAVRARVEEDWRAATGRTRNEAAYAALRKDYTVKIDE